MCMLLAPPPLVYGFHPGVRLLLKLAAGSMLAAALLASATTKACTVKQAAAAAVQTVNPSGLLTIRVCVLPLPVCPYAMMVPL